LKARLLQRVGDREAYGIFDEELCTRDLRFWATKNRGSLAESGLSGAGYALSRRIQ